MKIKTLLAIIGTLLVVAIATLKPLESKRIGLYLFEIEKVKKNPDKVFFYSTIYKRVSIIPLETNESCLIGIISKIRVFDQFIFVLDFSSAKTLFVFDKEGHFIRKIGNVGQGPGEYIMPIDFTIDIDNKALYILDYPLQRINKYDLATGRFIQAIDLKKEVRSFNIEYFAGKLYADANFRQHNEDNYLLRVIEESSGKEQSNYLNVMEYNQEISNVSIIQKNVFHFRENGNPVFIQQFMNHVIVIEKDSIFSLVELKGIDFYLNSEEVNELKRANINQGSTETIRRLNKYHSINGFIEKGDLILMDIEKGHTLQKFLIQKKTKQMSVFQSFRDDLLFFCEIPYPVPTYGCYDSGGVYYYVNSHSISNYQAFAKDGVLSPDLGRLEDLKHLEEDTNPFIIYYEFKD